jgi:hypothetical protein
VGVGNLAAGAEELLQIIVLAVDVSAHSHRDTQRHTETHRHTQTHTLTMKM